MRGIFRAFSPHPARERATFSPREKAFPLRGGVTPPYMALYKNVFAQADSPNLNAKLSTLNSAQNTTGRLRHGGASLFNGSTY